MKKILRQCLLGWLLLCSLGGALAWPKEPQNLRLLGRSHVSDYQVGLEEADWRWLRNKGLLVVGISSPDYLPFDITSNNLDYEGISADYVQLLAELMHLQVRVRRYGSRAEALAALKAGEIDLLATANGFEAGDPALVMSQPYAEDLPTLVSRIGDSQNLEPELGGKRVAMLYHYLLPQTVEAFYPKATLQLYPSTLSAIGAVAFGQADVYLGDSISASYLINKNYLNNVQLTDFSRLEGKNFAFALVRDNERLARIVDAALAVIPMGERMGILRRWSAGGISLSSQKLQFSVNEQRWLDKHPRLRVVVDDGFPPISYYTEEGEFRGISADILAKVALRTGLKFDVQRVSSVKEMIDHIVQGKADMLITLSPSHERETSLRFTRPYLVTPFVLVTRTSAGSPSTLDEMAGKRLAVTAGSSTREMLGRQYPDIRLVDARKAQDALVMVAAGEADGAINSMVTAGYMISRQYRDRLRATTTVGVDSALVSFATARGSLELYSIMDKALQSIPPEELDELTNRWRNEVVLGDSYWLRNRTAILRGFAMAAVLLLIAGGWITYLRLMVQRRKQAERALNDQVEFMRVLIDGTPHPIYVRDPDGRLLICNAGYLQELGVERENMIGRTLLEVAFIDPREAEVYQCDYQQVMQDGLPQIKDRQLKMPDGRTLTIYHWMLPYRGGDGAVRGMIGGWIDISERLNLMQELREAKERADDANRAKTTFLATMSHEIRTPMNAVIGMLELALKKADQGVSDRGAIEEASSAAHGLLDLIGDILDVTRIESGRLSLAPERANLRNLLESVVRIFDGLARQKRLSLTLDLDVRANCDVLIDPLRFKQIVSNLLSNAIKFTSEGQVHLCMTVEPDDDNQRLGLILRVEDSGSGISEDDQRRLFSPFAQAGNNQQSARSGSGLGLVISRTLCEMMGGHLSLSSELGKGTDVEVALNLAVLRPLLTVPRAEASTVAPGQSLNILVIDDYPANRRLLSQQLVYLGHRVEDAEDGAHGLRAWRKGDFDVLITDCNMPIMSGHELVRAIRDEERTQGMEPRLILGFTANAQPEERTRCLDAGMDDCLFKPISLQDLSARLNAVISKRGVSRAEVDVEDRSDDIDLSGLMRLTRGDRGTIQSLLGDLAGSNDSDMARLIQLFTQHDRPGLADLAHRVKGGARIINARALIQCCENLERACDGLDSAQLTEAVDALQQAMERLAQWVERFRQKH
ncbi:hybrid sensor histidine kinase/response regulator [Pseudomonas sp. Eqa60]|uniref:transporter substrate-binding domain-containing protein n=1 Tax=Pseudomonas sp. Eqa60 TaxID=2799184 RepID=UPI001BB38EAB|nr:transporter substrate-binding domain-containing protein [Pseudomonas sp. Eqa60]BCQ69801.1 hybrid sensor histidine kinase/response regulator [Pseudomonas sp. Eqa60]